MKIMIYGYHPSPRFDKDGSLKSDFAFKADFDFKKPSDQDKIMIGDAIIAGLKKSQFLTVRKGGL